LCPNNSIYPIKDRLNWKDFYPDVEGQIPSDVPKSKGPKDQMTVNVDADHAHDLVTRFSITDILLILNNTLIRWLSELQNTLETSTYGSELVASIIGTELIHEVSFMLISLGVDLHGTTLMLR
jgi:hypothetical protein